MNKIVQWLDKYLIPPMIKLTDDPHMKSIRDGITLVVPILLIGTIVLFFFATAKTIPMKMLEAFRQAMGLISVVGAFTFSYYMAKNFKLNPILLTITGGVIFLSTIPSVFFQGSYLNSLLALASSGLFVAIIVAVFTARMAILFTSLGEKLLPAHKTKLSSVSLVILTVGIIVLFKTTNFNFHNMIMVLLKPVISASDSLFAVLGLVLVETLLWTAGIHGPATVGPIVTPVYLLTLQNNAQAAASNIHPLPHIVTTPFFQWVFPGGAGATLGLAFLLLFSRSKKMKKIGQAFIVPSLFNLNEPIIFCLPLVMNPILAIPFIFGPLILCVITYLCMYFDLVQRAFIFIPSVLPTPLAVYLVTGGDIRAVFLALFNIALITVIYYPFFRAYEKKVLAEEEANPECDTFEKKFDFRSMFKKKEA